MYLAQVYCDHGEALEADFFRFWGLDINEVGLRRMRNLFERLPYNSEVHFEINDTPEEARFWDIDTYMLANIFDIINALDWHTIAANTKHPPKPPKPIKRPNLKRPEKKAKGFWPGRTIVDKGVQDG